MTRKFHLAFAVLCVLISVQVGIAVYSEIRLIRLWKTPSYEKRVSGIYDGHPFTDQRTMQIYIAGQAREKYWPWTAPLEEWLATIILATCATGRRGGVSAL
jgi:hypothetical protein